MWVVGLLLFMLIILLCKFLNAIFKAIAIIVLVALMFIFI